MTVITVVFEIAGEHVIATGRRSCEEATNGGGWSRRWRDKYVLVVVRELLLRLQGVELSCKRL